MTFRPKGPFAGPFLLCGAGLACLAAAPLAAQDSAFHDTYYVVDTASRLVSLLTVTVGVLAAWWVILRLSRHKPRRLFAITLSAFAVGSLIVLLPLESWSLGTDAMLAAMQLSWLGSALSGLGVLVTAITLVWTLLAALIDRL